jgi:hypothetical protein
MIVGCFIIYLFQRFIDFLFKPLITLGAEDSTARVNEAVIRKQVKREQYQRRVAANPTDPMCQFSLRFLEKPESYKGNPDNVTYLEWYNEWKKGLVIDTTLRWAPACLEHDGTMRPNFIHYLKIQLALHKKASMLARIQFLNTISRHYPELTASYKGLEEDLANYEAEATEKGLKVELEKEVTEYGLPAKLAGYLVTKDINATEFKKTAMLLKRYSDQGYCPEACICAVENKVKDLEKIGVIHQVVTERDLPAEAGLAYANGEMTEAELDELEEIMDDIVAKFGSDAFEVIDGCSMYDGMLEAALRSYRVSKRAALFA